MTLALAMDEWTYQLVVLLVGAKPVRGRAAIAEIVDAQSILFQVVTEVSLVTELSLTPAVAAVFPLPPFRNLLPGVIRR